MGFARAGRSEAWAPERIDEVDDSKRKDDARTKNHENSCGQDALPILWAHHFEIEQAAVSWRFCPADGGLTPLNTAQGELYEALRNCPLKLALRIWSSSWYNTVSFLERTR